MKKYTFKKSIILPILAAASLGMSSLAFADTNNNNTPAPGSNNNGGSNQIVTAIKDVGNKLVALGFAGMNAFNQAMYQFDQNMAKSLVSNASAKAVTKDSGAATAARTNNYIQTTMQNVPDSFLSTSELAFNANKIEKQIKEQNAMVNNLTLGVPASDTLYINNPLVLAAGYGSLSPAISHYYNSDKKYTIGPPPVNDDKYFSISSILSPAAYTPTGLNAANAYMAYLTQSYNNPADSLRLSSLKSYINSLKASKQPQALYQFLSSAQYQTYQLAMRSYMANKSIAINNFEHLIAERTPSKTPVKGIYNSNGQPITHPSPLQVENYQADHRIDNPAWIESLQTMSSASLQREIAIELAQMLKQNQQAHLNRERILTTLSALQLQTSEGTNMELHTIAQQVNQEISNMTGSHHSNSQGETAAQARQQAEQDAKKQQEQAAKHR